MIRRMLTVTLLATIVLPAEATERRIAAGSDLVQFQEVLNTAVYGDTVVVEPGDYFARVMMPSGVTLRSAAGPDSTIIRFERIFVVRAESTDSLTTVEGFTINGSGVAEGIIVADADARLNVRNCVLNNGWSGVRAMYSTITVEDCVITECMNGVYMYESEGRVTDTEVRKCVNGINLISSDPRLQRNYVWNNSVGINLAEHSAPSIGGTLASANRIQQNPGGAINNEAMAKKVALRTMKPHTVRAPYNYWGTDCPDSQLFRGNPVIFSPWVDESGTRSLEECVPEPDAEVGAEAGADAEADAE